jgi:peptide/nickel transport system substrate-binding protein
MAAVGAAALSMVGCGGGDDGGETSSTSGLLQAPTDTTSKAKPGGTLKDYVAVEATSFDVIADATSSVYGQISPYGYQRLIKFKTSKYPEAATGEMEGDAAESFEVSGDRLQVTFKLRPGIKFDARAPTNGRVMDSSDVMYTWDRFSKLSPNRGDVVYNATSAPFSPVESMSAPDSRTIVVKLKQPDAAVLQLFAYNRNFYIMPKEAEGGFNPKGDVRGSGPWILAESRPSAGRVWRRNPDYYVKGRPLFDAIDIAVLPEYASRLAQFKAGNIWTSVATQEDIVQTKRDVPDTVLRQADEYSNISSVLLFGYNGDSPFKDERVRQAVSMGIDRETLIDVIGNRDKFAADGLELQTRYHTVINASWDGFWVDPENEKEFGSNAKYYQYNLAEAKKLLSAAGYANGFDTELFYNGGTNYGVGYRRAAEIAAGLLPEIGIRAKQNPREYNDYLPNYHYGYTRAQHQGEPPGYNGVLLKAAGTRPTADLTIFHLQHSKGVQYDGYALSGSDPRDGDPEVDRAIERFRTEFDLEKQMALIQDYQRMMAKKSYRIALPPFGALSFILHWPVIANFGVYDTAPGGAAPPESALHWWFDPSQAPEKKA